MAVTIKAKGGGSAKDALKVFQKAHGDTVGNFGGNPNQADRCPTGLFPFDLATGGGFPRCRASMVYGPESSGKTNLILRAIATNQMLRPHETNVFIGIEPFDPPWARKMGVDTDKVIVLNPNFAEDVVDMAESFLNSDDCGVVAIDSLAAMITTSEAASDAEKAVVGGSSIPVGKLVRKTTHALNTAEKQGRSPTLIYINQTRFKIGVMFGDPTTLPGGNAPRFQSALTIRTFGKNIVDSKISDQFPVRKEITFAVMKNKCPIIATHGKMELVTHPHDGMQIGDVDDFTIVATYLKDLGFFNKHEKKGYDILGTHYPTQNAFADRLREDRVFGNEVRQAVIKTVLAAQDASGAPGISVDEDGVVK